VHDDGMMSIDLLNGEATRQLNICNSCRYCEGLCAVFPAVERRQRLTTDDITQLANLCHDCRACFSACMYSPPHEFGINLPQVLSEVRVAAYTDYLWPRRVPRLLRGWCGVVAGIVVAVIIMVGCAIAFSGPASIVRRPSGPGSPYDLIPYPVLLVLMLVPAVFSVTVLTMAGRRYWKQTASVAVAGGWPALGRAIADAVGLRYLRGGGGGCYYPDDETPSRQRRILHSLVAGGFVLCLVSTSAAAVLQDFLGSRPPYPLLSLPVLTGTIGGAAIVVGCAWLLGLKAHASETTSVRAMTIKDYGLLVALAFLALTGLLTLVTRTTAAYGVVLLIHLGAVCLLFASAPYSKFVHVIYRFLALVRDSMESRAERQ
jgi:citrate/tricarballylate utilization protein